MTDRVDTPGAQPPRARPELCVGAIATDADRLLLIRRATPPEPGRWSLPGGRVEHGESVVEAVVREVREETGLEVVCDGLVGWVERIVDPGHHFVILDFAVTVLGGEAVASTDASDVAWVPIHRVPELPLVEGLLDFLADHDVIDTL